MAEVIDLEAPVFSPTSQATYEAGRERRLDEHGLTVGSQVVFRQLVGLEDCYGWDFPVVVAERYCGLLGLSLVVKTADSIEPEPFRLNVRWDGRTFGQDWNDEVGYLLGQDSAGVLAEAVSVGI